jgi:DNA-binding LacI/PurR family transcriptional regulator
MSKRIRDKQRVGREIALKHRHDASSSSEPLYEQVKLAITRQIAAGQIKRGEQLPPLRQLCEQLQMAYATVARGVRELVDEGILEAKTARGTRVAQRRTGRRGAIGLLGLRPLTAMLKEAPYFRTILYQLQENLVGQGQTVVYDHWTPTQPLREMFQRMRLVDGLVLMGFREDHLREVEALRRLGIPTVIVGETFKHHHLATVDSDNEQDTARAVRAMQKMGHRHIAFVGAIQPPGRPTVPLRVAGYERAMNEAGLSIDNNWIIRDNPENWATRLLALRPNPTAILLSGLDKFPQLSQDLKGTALEPGKKLLVCAYDENLSNILGGAGIEHIRIDQPLEKITTATVSMMLAMLGDPAWQPEAALLPATLIHVGPDGSAHKL